jgi:hypothetical protein
MTHLEMKKKVLGLIEELNPDSEYLTDDPDIATKLNEVINQIMFELVRMKKLPDYVEIEVEEGDLVRFADIEKKGKYEVYQIGTVKGVPVEFKASGSVIKALESGVMEIDYFKYPERITSATKDNFEYELPNDLLEIMPYGVAGDVLKSDISADYGRIYSDRYELLKSQLDPRYAMSSVYIEGGVDI